MEKLFGSELFILLAILGIIVFQDFAEMDDGSLILTGATWNGSPDMWLVKLNADGCLSDTVCDSLSTSVAIIDPAEVPNFLIYPNPAKDYLQLSLSGNTALFEQQPTIIIRDIQGRTVLEQVVETYTARDVRLDVSGFAEGMYIVMLKNDGRLLARQKVVIIR